MELNYKKQYRWHKYDAIKRDIPFLISYEEWLQVWQSSGHLHERGNKKGQYCMARFGDVGLYGIDNVKIILHSENVKEGLLGKPKSQTTRERMTKPKSPEHRAKLVAHCKARTWDKGLL